MRETHMESPLHRVERWTGSFFRAAELWEAGVYVLIPHHSGESICPALQWNKDTLEGFQKANDAQEQITCQDYASSAPCGHKDSQAGPGPDQNNIWENAQDDFYEADVAADAELGRRLDRMFQRQQSKEDTLEDLMEDWEDNQNNNEQDDDEDNLVYPLNYMPTVDLTCGPTGQQAAGTPRTDALANPYVRVVHVNGVHHIALVYCTCRGADGAHSDLMAQRLIPTSFTRYRTVFTHAVLDDFRITNLECKASAYHYFQKLRRHTSPMAPDTVPNLYHELRRMSRVWRWMKKLKWAGFAHKDQEMTAPNSGELANFCLACPQVGINIPDDWILDQNKCV